MVNFYFIQRLCLRKGLSLNKLSSRFWIVNHKTTRYILITRRSYHHLLQYYCYIRDRAKLLPDRIGISCVGSATKSSLFSGYIINHLLAKLVRSRWLHTCPFFFFILVIDLDFDSVHKNAKRSKANIRASWPLVCPITHIYWLPEHETGTIYYYYYYRRELFNDS